MLHRERLHSIPQSLRAGRSLRANSKDENLPINKIVYHTGDASALTRLKRHKESSELRICIRVSGDCGDR